MLTIEQNKKLVDVALASVPARLVADAEITKQEDCKGTGRFWLPAKGSNFCFYITQITSGRDFLTGCLNNDIINCENPVWASDLGNDFYAKLTKQGIDLKVRPAATIPPSQSNAMIES